MIWCVCRYRAHRAPCGAFAYRATLAPWTQREHTEHFAQGPNMNAAIRQLLLIHQRGGRGNYFATLPPPSLRRRWSILISHGLMCVATSPLCMPCGAASFPLSSSLSASVCWLLFRLPTTLLNCLTHHFSISILNRNYSCLISPAQLLVRRRRGDGSAGRGTGRDSPGATRGGGTRAAGAATSAATLASHPVPSTAGD